MPKDSTVNRVKILERNGARSDSLVINITIPNKIKYLASQFSKSDPQFLGMPEFFSQQNNRLLDEYSHCVEERLDSAFKALKLASDLNPQGQSFNSSPNSEFDAADSIGKQDKQCGPSKG